MYQMIEQLIKSDDLLMAGETLKEIDCFLTDNAPKRMAFCKALSKRLCQFVLPYVGFSFLNPKPYQILPVGHSIPMYFYLNGLASGKVRETRANIKTIIEYIDSSVLPASGNCLSKENIKTILNTADEKFHYFKAIPKGKPLLIMNLNNSDRTYNSYCSIEEANRYLNICMLHMKDDSTAPEYVFLHELGHIFQVSITDSTTVVPEEFFLFYESLKGAQPLQRDNPDASEVFADIFAVAVMHGTPLMKYNPFGFPEQLNEVFELFFTKLFEKYSG